MAQVAGGARLVEGQQRPRPVRPRRKVAPGEQKMAARDVASRERERPEFQASRERERPEFGVASRERERPEFGVALRSLTLPARRPENEQDAQSRQALPIFRSFQSTNSLRSLL